MGYDTHHYVKTDVTEKLHKQIIKELREYSDNAEFVIDEDGDSMNFGSWNTSEEDLRTLSKTYPNVLFTYFYEGGDSYIPERVYFNNGGMQIASPEIIFPEFCESKLDR